MISATPLLSSWHSDHLTEMRCGLLTLGSGKRRMALSSSTTLIKVVTSILFIHWSEFPPVRSNDCKEKCLSSGLSHSEIMKILKNITLLCNSEKSCKLSLWSEFPPLQTDNIGRKDRFTVGKKKVHVGDLVSTVEWWWQVKLVSVVKYSTPGKWVLVTLSKC